MKQRLSRQSVIRFLMTLFCFAGIVFTLHITARAEGFSCYATDANGYRIDSYYSEADNCYYLFLTAMTSIPDITVHLDGSVLSASAGILSEDNHLLTGAFSADGDHVVLIDAATGEPFTLTVLQSDLPCLCIDLNNTTLEQVHQDKTVKYENTSLFLSDPTGTYDTVSADDVTFKGRGNSSWLLYDKKGYQIKFNKKESVLGMPAAKKWVLLANACDDSLMRNYLAFHLAKETNVIDSPDSAFVDLWINGDYRGTYLITEKVEIGKGRVELTDPLGGLFERDSIFYAEEDFWFQDDLSEDIYVVKEAVNEDPETVMNTLKLFQDRLYDLERFLSSDRFSPENTSLDELGTLIDTRSFAGFYLVNEYMLNRESISSSFYCYLDGEGDVLHLGPLWDFDTCAGNEFSEDSSAMYYVHTDTLFSELLRCESFKNYVTEIYETHKAEFMLLPELCEETGKYLEHSASMNYIRWNCLGTAHAKGEFHTTYADAVQSLAQWLENRSNRFKVPGPYLYTVVSTEGKSIRINLNTQNPYKTVRFPVWSSENGQNDLIWYDAKKQSRGVWSCTINTADWQTSGTYNIHAYAVNGENMSMIGHTVAYVE